MIIFNFFSQKWDGIKTLANYEIKDFFQEDELENIEQQDKENYKQKKEDFKCKTICQNCIVCYFDVLRQYNLTTSAYKNVFLAYTYILTLSCFQVNCERKFSKLKYILNRLRNCLSKKSKNHFF